VPNLSEHRVYERREMPLHHDITKTVTAGRYCVKLRQCLRLRRNVENRYERTRSPYRFDRKSADGGQFWRCLKDGYTSR